MIQKHPGSLNPEQSIPWLFYPCSFLEQLKKKQKTPSRLANHNSYCKHQELLRVSKGQDAFPSLRIQPAWFPL